MNYDRSNEAAKAEVALYNSLINVFEAPGAAQPVTAPGRQARMLAFQRDDLRPSGSTGRRCVYRQLPKRFAPGRQAWEWPQGKFIRVFETAPGCRT